MTIRPVSTESLDTRGRPPRNPVRMDAQLSAAPPPLDRLRERYLVNLEALYARNPALAAELDSLPFSACPELIPARDGNFTCKRAADDGPELSLHSRYEPLAETRRLLDAQPAPDNPTFVVHGLGLGYVATELEARHDRPMLIVAEDDPALIKAALCVSDLGAQIRAGRLLIFTRAEKTALHEMLQTCNADLMLGVQFIALPYTKRSHAAFFTRFSAELAEFVTFARMHMFTLLKTARMTVRNVALNLPHYLRGRDIAELAGAARGYPAILVAAGPSAAAHVTKLGGLRDRAVLIAVQTVFKLLRSLEITPHFVTALDFTRSRPTFSAASRISAIANSSPSRRSRGRFRTRIGAQRASFSIACIRRCSGKPLRRARPCRPARRSRT